MVILRLLIARYMRQQRQRIYMNAFSLFLKVSTYSTFIWFYFIILGEQLLKFSALLEQGIIIPTRMKTFAKEPKSVKLLRKLKPTPVSCNKKRPMSVMADFLCFFFLALFCGMTCKWVLFLYAL